MVEKVVPIVLFFRWYSICSNGLFPLPIQGQKKEQKSPSQMRQSYLVALCFLFIYELYSIVYADRQTHAVKLTRVVHLHRRPQCRATFLRVLIV